MADLLEEVSGISFDSQNLSLVQIATDAFYKDHVFQAIELWNVVKTDADERDLPENRIRARNALGLLYMDLGDLDHAISLFQDGCRITGYDSDGSLLRARLLILVNLCSAYFLSGNSPAALQHGEEAVAMLNDEMPPTIKGYVFHGISAVYLSMEDWNSAASACIKALEAYNQDNDDACMAPVLTNLSISYSHLGMPDAESYLLRAIELAGKVDDFRTLADSYTELARIALLRDGIDEALELGSKALTTLWSHVSILDKSEMARVCDIFGQIALKAGDRKAGLSFLQRASTYYAQSNLWREWSDLAKLMDSKVKPQASVNADTARFVLDSRDHGVLNYFTSLLSLLDVMEGLFPGLKMRSELVTQYALLLASEIGVSGYEREVLSHTGRLHDIGLTSLDLELAGSSSELSSVAKKRAEAHPVIGEQTLSSFPVPPECLKVTRHHHESWDGSGYPDGLRGEQIPLLSRVLAVAEVYVTASTSEHIHSELPFLGHTKGLGAIREASVLRLDPALVEAFIKMHEPNVST